MSDFKTCGDNISYAGVSPYTFGMEGNDLCHTLNSLCDIKPSLILNCDGVTFKLNELDIHLDSADTERYLNNVDRLVINDIEFIKNN